MEEEGGPYSKTNRRTTTTTTTTIKKSSNCSCSCGCSHNNGWTFGGGNATNDSTSRNSNSNTTRTRTTTSTTTTAQRLKYGCYYNSSSNNNNSSTSDVVHVRVVSNPSSCNYYYYHYWDVIDNFMMNDHDHDFRRCRCEEEEERKNVDDNENKDEVDDAKVNDTNTNTPTPTPKPTKPSNSRQSFNELLLEELESTGLLDSLQQARTVGERERERELEQQLPKQQNDGGDDEADDEDGSTLTRHHLIQQLIASAASASASNSSSANSSGGGGGGGGSSGNEEDEVAPKNSAEAVAVAADANAINTPSAPTTIQQLQQQLQQQQQLSTTSAAVHYSIRGDRSIFVSREYRRRQQKQQEEDAPPNTTTTTTTTTSSSFQSKHPLLHHLIETLTNIVRHEFMDDCDCCCCCCRCCCDDDDDDDDDDQNHDDDDDDDLQQLDFNFEFDFDFDMTSVQVATYPGDGVSGYVKHCDRSGMCRRHEHKDEDEDSVVVTKRGSGVGNGQDDGDNGVDGETTTTAAAAVTPQVPQRLITCVYYLTDHDWHPTKDGGALRVFHGPSPRPKSSDTNSHDDESDRYHYDDSDDYFTDIIPFQDRLVVFRSDKVEHQVMPSMKRPRTAITVWFYGTTTTKRKKKKKVHQSQAQQQHQQQYELSGSGGEVESSSSGTATTIFKHPHDLPPLPICQHNLQQQDDNQNHAPPKIFVSIASYRDSELVPTLRSLVGMAQYPTRLAVGVVLQLDTQHSYDQNIQQQLNDFIDEQKQQLKKNNSNSNSIIDYSTSNNNIRVLRLDAKDALGPCYARGLCQTLWRPGEDYVLQIDSHMRFRRNWDTYLLETHDTIVLSRTTRRKEEEITSDHDDNGRHESSPRGVILTAYPVGYTLPDSIVQNNETRGTYLVPWKFDDNGMLRQRGRLLQSQSTTQSSGGTNNSSVKGEQKHQMSEAGYRHYFYAGGFNFGTAKACIHDVPYDTMGLPYLFFGEELSMAVRFFTHGYDMYAPSESVVYHLWSRSHRPPTSTSTETDGNGQSRLRQSQKMKSQERVYNQLVGHEQEVGKTFGLGTVRPSSEFAEALGVDFDNRGFTKENVGCGVLSPTDFAPSSLNFACGDGNNGGTATSKTRQNDKTNFNQKVASLDPKAQALIGKFLMGSTGF